LLPALHPLKICVCPLNVIRSKSSKSLRDRVIGERVEKERPPKGKPCPPNY